MPQVKPNAFTRWLGRTVLRLGGWRVVGTIPDLPRLVLIAAPHSSNWDGYWGMAAKIALGLEVRVLGKAQLFWWPLGPLLRRLGVVPLDRSSPQGTVDQAVALIRNSERMWYALTPEGTRKAVKEWKAGFLKIARLADVPILAAYFHYPEKIIGVGPLFHPSGDDAADMAAIRQWYRPWQGKTRGTF
ncbi:lysophospholipid acyltransferase family protein [Xanthomonas sp. H13-6]|uniref:Lysophospholipid acyltransferase family protein n=2 Tax=Xanthomonas chitinilytica TaxID=2989819 RepID=A0ABT3JYX3_9XANT|nr:lysophospholipid acyltransferase family protein [Xanthomonas sp. H13-6]MCW4473664.1 lysophospholipid acyltransferase family protein [Xanthomonas sp. H13-6]